MKNYCISYYLFYITPGGKECPYSHVFTKVTALKHAKKYGLPHYCIATVHTENGVETVVKKEYFYD